MGFTHSSYDRGCNHEVNAMRLTKETFTAAQKRKTDARMLRFVTYLPHSAACFLYKMGYDCFETTPLNIPQYILVSAASNFKVINK